MFSMDADLPDINAKAGETFAVDMDVVVRQNQPMKNSWNTTGFRITFVGFPQRLSHMY